MAVYKGMLLEERMARVELEQRIEANGGVVPTPPLPPPHADGALSSAGAVVGASSKLLGGIRRLGPKDSWGRARASASPLPGGAVRSATEAHSGGKKAASAFFKGVAGGLGALANDLADAALGTDPTLAHAARGGATPPSGGRGAPLAPSPPRSPLPDPPTAHAAAPEPLVEEADEGGA